MKKGDLINIFINHKYETKFEGVARLVELKTREHSFISVEEKLFTRLEDKAIGINGKHLPLTKREKENNAIYFALINLFEGNKNSSPHASYKELYKKAKRLTNKQLDSPKKLDKLIWKYKFNWINCIDKRSLLLNYSNDTLIRFFQQRFIAKWSPCIWRTEKWLVEFIPEQYCLDKKVCLFSKPFRTVRKIKTLLCISPNEDAQNCQIRHFSTGTELRDLGRPISNADKKEVRDLKKEEEEEEKSLLKEMMEEMPEFFEEELDPTSEELQELDQEILGFEGNLFSGF